MNFSTEDFLVNVTKPAVNLVTFTEEIINEKLDFLWSE